MNAVANAVMSPDAYGVLTEPATLTIKRVLPGSVERVWDYLTRSDLRRQWLAAGDMDLRVGGTFEFVWRNEELNGPPSQRPEGFPEEHRMQGEVTACEPPHRLSISWGSTGGVDFTLEQQGDKVLLTLVHHRLPDRSIMLNVSAGWHMHLDVLVATVAGETPEPFWDGWQRLKQEYAQRLPA